MSVEESLKSLTERVDILSKDVRKISQILTFEAMGFSDNEKKFLDKLAERMMKHGINQYRSSNFVIYFGGDELNRKEKKTATGTTE